MVYLDMNIWVAMSRGSLHGDIRWKEARVGLERAVATGRVVVPLSVAHYLELWHRRDEQSREQVGALMRDISSYATITSPYAVRRKEVRASISRLADSSARRLATEDLIGDGAAHAFNSLTQIFRPLAAGDEFGAAVSVVCDCAGRA